MWRQEGTAKVPCGALCVPLSAELVLTVTRSRHEQEGGIWQEGTAKVSCGVLRVPMPAESALQGVRPWCMQAVGICYLELACSAHPAVQGGCKVTASSVVVVATIS